VKLLKWLFSKWHGHQIGEIRYVKSSPFITGPISCLLPMEIWDDREYEKVRYHINKQKWDGFRWVHIAELQKTRDELNDLLKRTF